LQPVKDWTGAVETSLLGGELALPVSGGTHQPLHRHFRYYSEPLWLASVLCGYLGHHSGEADPNLRPSAKNATLRGSVFAVLRWSLASQICGGRWLFPPRLLQTVPAGHPFSGPLCVRMLLPGVCFSLGWPDFTPAAGTSLAPSLLQSGDRLHNCLISSSYRRIRPRVFCILEGSIKINPENHRNCIYPWHFGQ